MQFNASKYFADFTNLSKSCKKIRNAPNIIGGFKGGGWQSITPPLSEIRGGVPPPGFLQIISHLKYSFYSFYINNKVYLKVTTL